MAMSLSKQVCCIIAACFVIGTTDACTIVDKREARLGTDRGIQGRCANNGQSITCILDADGEGIDCTGPYGEFTGDTILPLVRAACGCSAPRQDPQNLEQQLEAFP